MRNHHIEYVILNEPFPRMREERYYCSGPVIALNEFHRQMQLHREMEQDRKTIIRRKLLPKEYMITRLYQKYDDGQKKSICSDFDLPSTPNPNIVEEKEIITGVRKAAKDPNNFFGFYGETKGEKPEDNTLPSQA